jgi:rhamnopyranosyl-N-acetylglucosaminyl-diphospho-decaprenol beta-1,3/1,4-galactofuranosyltransferase
MNNNAHSSIGAKVCLVIVTYNRYRTLLQTLEKTSNQSRKPDYIVVVDNHSDDDTCEQLRHSGFVVDTIRLSDNLGYGAGLEAGIQHGLTKYPDSDFFWLMDDDSHPSVDALATLLSIKEKIPFEGLLGTRGFIDTIWKGPVTLSQFKNRAEKIVDSIYGVYRVDHALVDGALVDRCVIDKVGAPSGRFFMMCEDLEYSKRLRRAGFQLMVTEDERLMERLHFGGGVKFSKGTLWRGYYHARNHLLILKEYFTWKAFLTYIVRQTKYLLASLLAPDRFVRIHFRLTGIIHGLSGTTGKTIDPKKL